MLIHSAASVAGLSMAPRRWQCDDASYRYWHAFITLSERRTRYTLQLDPPAGANEMQTEMPPVWPSASSRALDVLSERVHAVEGRRLRLMLPAFGAAIAVPQ